MTKSLPFRFETSHRPGRNKGLPALAEAGEIRAVRATLDGVDRATIERDLAQVESHISQGEQHIARQREAVAQYERNGRDAAPARDFLNRLEATQALHVAHRDRLKRQLRGAQ